MDLIELQRIYALRNLKVDGRKDVKALMIHLRSEVNELKEAITVGKLVPISYELADVIIQIVILANKLGIDIDKAVTAKTTINIKRYHLKFKEVKQQ